MPREAVRAGEVPHRPILVALDLLDQIEGGIGRAVRERPPPELRGMLQSVTLGDVQFNYPAPGHSIAIVQAQVNAVFVEQYQP